MPTLNQIMRHPRLPKIRREANPWLQNAPQAGGVVTQVSTMSPKKPNSAVRKIARVRLNKTKTIIIAYIPGEGHNVQEHAIVLIRGGKPKDLAGPRGTIIRGAVGVTGVKDRKSSRSRYGVKISKK